MTIRSSSPSCVKWLNRPGFHKSCAAGEVDGLVESSAFGQGQAIGVDDVAAEIELNEIGSEFVLACVQELLA